MGLILGVIGVVLFVIAGLDIDQFWNLTDLDLVAFGLAFTTSGAILGFRRDFSIS